MNRIEVIQGSKRCYLFGVLGLVPLLGFPFALTALMRYRRIHSANGSAWNPASSYLTWGFGYGILGLLITTIMVVLIAAAWLSGFD